MTKSQVHSILESLLHSVAKDGLNRHAKITIPYYELSKELGFGQTPPSSDLLITIRAEFIDETGGTDEETTREFTGKSKTRN